MKGFIAILSVFGLLFVQIYADEATKKADETSNETTIKSYKRLIPADVLRGEFFFRLILLHK